MENSVRAMEMPLTVADQESEKRRDDESRLDRTAVVCTRLLPAKGDSQVAGLRLSWPKASDGRRAVVGKSPPPSQDEARNRSGPRIVQVSQGDIEMHYRFSASAANGLGRPVLQVPLGWNPIELEDADKDLLEYFQNVASRSLATFGHDPADLGRALIRVALVSNSVSATALLRSLLALSSLHRHGVHTQAMELKISAIKALAAAPGGHVSTAEAVQHVAAGMLLCSFEIHQASCTSGQWMCYLDGVKNVITAAHLLEVHQDDDVAILLDWVYYHDVLARFTLRHWYRWNVEPSAPSAHAEVSRAAPSSLAIIGLLSEVCDAVPAKMTPPESTKGAEEHKNFVKILDWRIRSSPVATAAGVASSVMELYQLALLVYLGRVSGNLISQAAVRSQEQIDRAFAIISRLDSCDRQFPVFVLGCEARRDDQRAAVLDLISRTDKSASSRSFNFVTLLLQAVWAQDDLANHEIDYWDKLSYVISSCSIMPTFV